MVQAVSQTFQFTGDVGGGRYDSRFLAGIDEPSQPVITAAALGSGSTRITLSSYSANTDYFVLERSLSQSSGFSAIDSNVTVAEFPFDNTGLASNTTYYYRAAGVNSAGQSIYSPVVSATTSAGGNPDPTWYRSATFESLAVGANPSSASDGFTNRIGAGAVVSDIRAYTGTKSVECAIAQGATAFGGTINFTGGVIVAGQELWTRFRCWIPSTYNISTGDGGMKFFRYRTLSSGEVPQGSNTIQLWGTGTPDGIRTEQEGTIPDTRLFAIPLDEWVTFEVYAKLHQTTGALRCWVNGTLRGELINKNTSGAATWAQTQVKFLDFFNNGSPQAQSLWIDEIRIAWSGSQSPTNTDANGNVFIGL